MDFSEKAVAHAMHIILRCYEFKRQLPVDSTDYVTGIKKFIESKQIDLQEEIKRKAHEEGCHRHEAIFIYNNIHSYTLCLYQS